MTLTSLVQRHSEFKHFISKSLNLIKSVSKNVQKPFAKYNKMTRAPSYKELRLIQITNRKFEVSYLLCT